MTMDNRQSTIDNRCGRQSTIDNRSMQKSLWLTIDHRQSTTNCQVCSRQSTVDDQVDNAKPFSRSGPRCCKAAKSLCGARRAVRLASKSQKWPSSWSSWCKLLLEVVAFVAPSSWSSSSSPPSSSPPSLSSPSSYYSSSGVYGSRSSGSSRGSRW